MMFNSADRSARPDGSAISALIEALKQIHDAKAQTPTPVRIAEPTPSRRYQELRAGLEHAEANARRRDEAIERTLRARAASYQETLYLRCQTQGRSAGRFRCDNQLGHRTDVRIVRRRFTNGGAILIDEPSLTIDSVSFPLEAGSSAVVTVMVDLSSLPELTTGRLETSLDLVMDEALALKLWIEVEVYELC